MRIGGAAFRAALQSALLFAAFLISTPTDAQELHVAHCLHACPTGAPATNDVIVRSIYTLSSNDATKFADWVAYRVTRDTIGPTKPRVWMSDPALAPEETLEPNDYAGANSAIHVDRGHQAPLASFSGTADWPDTNYLSNITPQKSALNQGPWEQLESAERTLARRRDVTAVYVLTGPWYGGGIAQLSLPNADEPHRVPSGYWKIVALEERGHLRIAAFLMPQGAQRAAKFCDSASTVGEVERLTSLVFFPDLAATDRALLKTVSAPLKSDLGCDGRNAE